jgi:hypothetical protein
LARRIPQGFNPTILILDRTEKHPMQPAAQVETVVEVHYEEKTDKACQSIDIQPDGASIPVQEVPLSTTR